MTDRLSMPTVTLDLELGLFVAAWGPNRPLFGPVEIPDDPNVDLASPISANWWPNLQLAPSGGQIQAGTNCGRLAGGLRGPSEFLRTKRSARVFSVGLRLSSFLSPQSSVLSSRSSILGPRSSILGPQSSVLGPQSSVVSPRS